MKTYAYSTVHARRMTKDSRDDYRWWVYLMNQIWKKYFNLLQKITMDKSIARENGYFIITTDDWDRYLYEVFADGEMHSIEWNSEDANEKLEELWEKYCKINNLDSNQKRKWN